MAERRERLLKLTQEKKNHKMLVKSNQPTCLGPITELARDGSSGSSGPREVVQHAIASGNKRSRPEGGPADLIDEGSAARAFTLPPCFVEKDFFEGFPLIVSDGESEVIRRLDEEGTRQHLASGMVGLMKVAEMVVVLAGEGANSSAMVSKLASEKAALQEKA